MLESGHTIADYWIVKPLAENQLYETYQVTGAGIESAKLLLINPEHFKEKKSRQAFDERSQVLMGQSFPGLCTLTGAEAGEDYSYCLYPIPPGSALAEKLSDEFTVRRSLEIVRQLANCLKAPHASGLWHGAISPQVIFLDAESVCVDLFALSSLMPLDFHSGVDPCYSSPELVRGEPLGTASDLYSLGVVLYRLLTGAVPFDTGDPFSTAMQHVQETAAPLEGTLALLQPLLDGLLCVALGDRMTADQLVERIDGYLQNPEIGNLKLSDEEIPDIREEQPVVTNDSAVNDKHSNNEKLSAIEKLMHKSDMASRIEERLKDRAEVLQASQEFTPDAKRASTARMSAIGQQSYRKTQNMNQIQYPQKSGSSRLLLLITLGIALGAVLFLVILGPQKATEQAGKTLPGSLLTGLELGSQQLETGNLVAAEKTFQQLVDDYTLYPQPYNNLAALYAKQGDLERSRSFLERAMATDQSYVTVYRNLGTVYSEMARDSYGRALQLEKGQQAVTLQIFNGEQLLAVNSAVSTEPRPAAVRGSEPGVAAQEKQVDESAPDAAVKVATVETPRALVNEENTEPSAQEIVKEVATVQPAEVAEATEKAPELLAEVVLPPEPESAEEFLRRWAAAWSNQDVDAYLGFYGAEFIPADGNSREAWAKRRENRLTRPKNIEVTLEDFSPVRQVGDLMQLEVTQGYKSDRYADRTRKRFDLAHDGRDWQIIRERSLGRVR